ncbi:13604_t:CDS:2, partial [Gigaspora margarita]
MYCEVKVKKYLILLILDSGSSGCIVLANFLKDIGITIDRSSTVVIVGVHGEQKRPLSEIDNFPIMVEDRMITLKAVATEAGNYATDCPKETNNNIFNLSKMNKEQKQLMKNLLI